MTKEPLSAEAQRAVRRKPGQKRPAGRHEGHANTPQGIVTSLQRTIGNRVLQRLLAQRSGAFDLDDETAARISHQRGNGQPLDRQIQAQVGQALDADFSRVRLHTSDEADALSRQLNAKAFTTGHDIFFREGAYQPGSTSGRELITHELAHVIQQSSGEVRSSGSPMRVNAAGDAFEQQADAVANAVASASAGLTGRAGVEEEAGQGQEMDKEEEEATQP